ncbi:hypothetical protein SO802_000572 [Lithocarpus litseifolius]|uniref:Uncharacterized protein n=1 Tax=Lithocarpus litseifolius TaxID=425828 RepID=A0AAW2DS89_9ROSI
MGGLRSFVIESKCFQLVAEEGGRYFLLKIYERSKFFMRSVFMGKTVAQWLMKYLEYFVVEASPKLFFSLRDNNSAYTLQCSTNSFGQFLLLTELKVGGYRRSVIIPVGKDKNGWRVFGLELRKLLNPSHYAEVGMGLPTFSPQVLRPSMEAQNHRTYAEVVQASYGMARKLPKQLVSTAKEKMVVKQGLTGTKVGGLLVGKPAKLVVGGGDRRQMCINEKSEVGEQNQVGIRFPCLNSKAHWKERGVRRPCWTGSGLVVEVDGIGRRRVFWGRKKGGNQNLRWVSRTEKDQCKGGLGLGPNNLATHLPNNESVSWSGPVGTSPSAFEHGECSVTADEAFFSVGLLDEVGESPEESSPSPVSSSPRPELPAQRVNCY